MDHLALINYVNGLQAPGVASSQAAGPDHADLLADAALLLTRFECVEEERPKACCTQAAGMLGLDLLVPTRRVEWLQQIPF